MTVGDRGLEVEPAVTDPVGLVGFAHQRQAARLHDLELAAEHVSDALPALERRDVPGERNQIAPIGLLGEHRRRAVNVSCVQGRLEVAQPAGHGLGRGRHDQPPIRSRAHGLPRG